MDLAPPGALDGGAAAATGGGAVAADPGRGGRASNGGGPRNVWMTRAVQRGGGGLAFEARRGAATSSKHTPTARAEVEARRTRVCAWWGGFVAQHRERRSPTSRLRPRVSCSPQPKRATIRCNCAGRQRKARSATHLDNQLT